ncbi:hypothetical protein E4U46_003471 [Claviceps purpurea]|nr:hypothetical protein E4U46_003471 [Claviceps purpurea]
MASSQDEFLSPEEAARANRHAITSELPYSIRRFDRESHTNEKIAIADVEAFNVLTITYKTANDLYEKDKKHLGKLMQMVQSSVSMHYKDTCCNPERPLQHWIATLYVTAGDDDRHEQDQARDRYHKALQPMRNPNNWELWLVRYDEAASYAQKNGVVEVSPLNAIIKDFVTAVTKVAENWTSNFLDYGRDDPRMTRKEIMRELRVQMTNKYPNRLQLRSNTK